MPRSTLRDLNLEIHYEGDGDAVLEGFLIPTLERSIRYDRLTSFFNVSSLIAIARGLESLWNQEGRMRLVLGLHSVPEDLALSATNVDEWADTLISDLKERLLAEVSSLSDEFGRDRVATVAWMMHEGLLEVRVAAPRSALSLGELDPIFHSKRFILEDAAGDVVTAIGSPNETVAGLRTNFEDLTVHMSWQDPQGYVAVLQNSFEKIWKNERTGLVVQELHSSFAREILSRLGNQPPSHQAPPTPHRNELLPQILEVARSSPAFAIFNQGTSALYPHQERAFVDGLSRWPIRVLLADEVGLGKTLEGGSLVSYMMRFKGVENVLLLVPAGVIKQWQEELKLHFQIDAWRLDSARSLFVAPNGSVRDARGGITGDDAPNVVIASIQFARGDRRRGHVFSTLKEMPDLVLVDEAHSARLKVEADGSRRATLVWSMLDDIKDRVPHLVFLTATPVQVDPLEYLGLLNLLGLPELWQEESTYLRSLSALATMDPPSLDLAARTVESLASVVDEWKPLVGETGSILDDASLAKRAIAARSNWQETHALLVRTHPAHLLTIRNTRSALERYGYRFPERDLSAPVLDVSADLVDFYAVVDRYLSEAYGSVEEAIDPDRSGMGFAKSGYHQRLASSLHACRISLENRTRKIETLTTTHFMDPISVDTDESLEDSDELDSETLKFSPLDSVTVERVARAASVEKMYIRDLFDRLDRYETTGSDPKLDMLLELLDNHCGVDQVLVFSRFTDTLHQAHRAYLSHYADVPGHAMYTGGEAWVDRGDGPIPASKEGVRKALDDREAEVVFCSDAASEGLNLQAARVIINIDVPWNPARLEQRIGRIARLGQEADRVTIYNLWYPDSIEARIYSRLLARKDLYELAVGEFPELVSKAIKDELASRFRPGIAGLADDPLVLLQRLRENEQHVALQRIWGRDPNELPGSTKFRQRLLDFLSALAVAQGIKIESSDHATKFTFDDEVISVTAAPGKPTSLTLMSPVVDRLIGQADVGVLGNESAVLGAVISSGVPVGLCLSEGKRNRLVKPQDLPEVLLAASFLHQLNLSEVGAPEVSIGQPLRDLPLSDWLPNHEALSLGKGSLPEECVTEIRTLGRVPVSGSL